ncbi:hypothetical protein IKF76_00990 [Candidatus Saccharibacteria bacterium]|nr:hypothetical protein [Candidatus Saccharibacteria bacterium]
MKKTMSLLLVVMMLLATACSSNAAATTSSSTATTEAEASDEADTDVSDDANASDEATSGDTSFVEYLNGLSDNPDDYWVGSDEFRLRDYYWSLPPTEEVGFGWADDAHTKIGYVFCKVNGWKVVLNMGGVIWIENGERCACNVVAVKLQGDNVKVWDGFSVNRSTLEEYLIVLENILNHPDVECPFGGLGIKYHQHQWGISNCPDGPLPGHEYGAGN